MEVFQRHVGTICYLLFREGCTQITLKNSRDELQFMEAQLEMIKAEALGRKTSHGGQLKQTEGWLGRKELTWGMREAGTEGRGHWGAGLSRYKVIPSKQEPVEGF